MGQLPLPFDSAPADIPLTDEPERTREPIDQFDRLYDSGVMNATEARIATGEIPVLGPVAVKTVIDQPPKSVTNSKPAPQQHARNRAPRRPPRRTWRALMAADQPPEHIRRLMGRN